MYKAYIKSVVNVGAFQSNTLSKTDSGNKDILAHTKLKQMKKLPLNSYRQHGVYTDIYIYTANKVHYFIIIVCQFSACPKLTVETLLCYTCQITED